MSYLRLSDVGVLAGEVLDIKNPENVWVLNVTIHADMSQQFLGVQSYARPKVLYE